MSGEGQSGLYLCNYLIIRWLAIRRPLNEFCLVLKKFTIKLILYGTIQFVLVLKREADGKYIIIPGVTEGGHRMGIT